MQSLIPLQNDCHSIIKMKELKEKADDLPEEPPAPTNAAANEGQLRDGRPPVGTTTVIHENIGTINNYFAGGTKTCILNHNSAEFDEIKRRLGNIERKMDELFGEDRSLKGFVKGEVRSLKGEVRSLNNNVTALLSAEPRNQGWGSEALSCRQVWEEMNDLLSKPNPQMNDLLSKPNHVRNYDRRINMANYTVETDLFPIEALRVYSNYNLGQVIQIEDKEKYFSAHRGGSQGDYREGIQDKIANVVDCLSHFPNSKRAVITIPNNSTPVHSSDDDAKCMREIHFYLDVDEDGEAVLNATVWMRAQAAEIFPKNIHFVGSLMDTVANGLSNQGKTVIVGELFYLATTLVSVRED